MRVTITYEFRAQHADFPFLALATVDGVEYFACGNSYEDAEQRLVEKLRLAQRMRQSAAAVPPPKEIEVMP